MNLYKINNFVNIPRLKLHKKYFVVFLILAVFMVQQISIMGPSIFKSANNDNKDLIIVFGNDSTISSAVIELQNLNPGITTINFNPNTIKEVALKTTGSMYLVGHGSTKGLKFKNEILPWDDLVNTLIVSPASFIGFVACDSFGAMKYASTVLHKSNIYGLSGNVEPIYAALLITTMKHIQLKETNQISQSEQLLASRFQEIQQMNYYPTLSNNFLDINYWYTLAYNRLSSPSTGDYYGDSIVRGVTEAGSYASIYENYPDYYWMGMAAWVVLSVNVGKLILKALIGDGSLFGSSVSTMYVVCNSLYYQYFGNTITSSILQYIITQLFPNLFSYFLDFLNILSFGAYKAIAINLAEQIFAEFTSLESTIYYHAVWAFLANAAGGYKLVDYLFRANSAINSDYVYSDSGAQSNFDNHFYYVDNYWKAPETSSKVSSLQYGASKILTYEQQYVVDPTYSYYALSTDILSLIGFSWFGPDWTGNSNVLHFLQGDIPFADMNNKYDRVNWAINYLLPYYVQNNRLEIDSYHYIKNAFDALIQNGQLKGGYYTYSPLSMPDTFTGITISGGSSAVTGVSQQFTAKIGGLTAPVLFPVSLYTDWGDGSNTGWVSSNIYTSDSYSTIDLSHTYHAAGTYTIKTKFSFGLDSRFSSLESGYYTRSVYVADPPVLGCVAKNTPILLANGQNRNVQALKIGDQLMGYDYQTGQLIPVTLTNLTMSRVHTLININDGLLKLTPDDQPIYISNSTYTGWVINPKDLQVGDLMLDPVHNVWIPITSLTWEHGNFKVYDVRTSIVDNFIGGGVLLDRKVY